MHASSTRIAMENHVESGPGRQCSPLNRNGSTEAEESAALLRQKSTMQRQLLMEGAIAANNLAVEQLSRNRNDTSYDFLCQSSELFREALAWIKTARMTSSSPGAEDECLATETMMETAQMRITQFCDFHNNNSMEVDSSSEEDDGEVAVGLLFQPLKIPHLKYNGTSSASSAQDSMFSLCEETDMDNVILCSMVLFNICIANHRMSALLLDDTNSKSSSSLKARLQERAYKLYNMCTKLIASAYDYVNMEDSSHQYQAVDPMVFALIDRTRLAILNNQSLLLLEMGEAAVASVHMAEAVSLATDLLRCNNYDGEARRVVQDAAHFVLASFAMGTQAWNTCAPAA